MMHELVLAGALLFSPQVEKDSIGTETIDGRLFVIHRVDEKETLYAISRRYGASVESILQSNPGASANLEIGQILKVPYVRKVVTKSNGANTTHIVAAGETMYAISRTYGVTVDELKKWNGLSDNTLSVGQELIVRKGGASASSQPVAQPSTPVPAAGTHTVGSKETLFSIAKLYGLSIHQLREWNSLQSDDLKVGQVISLTADRKAASALPPAVNQEVKSETRPQAQTQPEPHRESTTARPQETTNEQPRAALPKEQPRTETPRTEPSTSTQPQTIRISESVKNSDEVVETGLAELIDGTEGNRKYLAMHRTAPVGTILKVRNEMNNREVFVRVMGKLPDTAVNDKLIIKLSRSAYDRLGAIDAKFRVELTYYK